jgi:DNA-binding GntR family transcriptional regulator
MANSVRASGKISASADAKILDVAKAVQNDILFGRFKARERLVEEELSARFDVGRHVVRAALDELDRQGLVSRRPNRGVVVSDPSISELEQEYDMRVLLQREGANQVRLPGSEETLAELSSLNEAFKKFRAENDLVQASNMNSNFHKTLFSAGASPVLVKSIQHFFVKTSPVHCFAIRDPASAMRSYEEHGQMIDAIRQGNRKALVELCIDHIMPPFAAFKIIHG